MGSYRVGVFMICLLCLELSFALQLSMMFEILNTLKNVSSRVESLEAKFDTMTEVASNLDTLYACHSPSLNHSSFNDDMVYIYGATVDVECQPGYIHYGARQLQCIGKDSWSGSAYCKPRDCNSPPDVEHGSYDATQPDYSTTLGAKISVTCDDGYCQAGTDTLRCELSDGQVKWVGYQACVQKRCVHFEDGSNSSICFLRHNNAQYKGGRMIGSTLYDTDKTTCMKHCLLLSEGSHRSLAYIMIYRWTDCTCYDRGHFSTHIYALKKDTYVTYIKENYGDYYDNKVGLA